MLGEGIVTAIVSRNGHDSTRTITRQHVFSNPDGYFLVRKRIDGIAAREHTRHLMVHLTVTLCALLHVVKVFFYLLLLLRCGQFCHQLRLRSQHHERHAEHRVGTGGEDGETLLVLSRAGGVIGYFEIDFRTLRATNPVALRLLQRVSPVNLLQSVKQSLSVGTHTQAPLAHLLLHHRVAAANADAINHLVVGKNGSQFRTPVHHRISQIGNAVVHQYLLLLLLREVVPVGGREMQLLSTQSIAVLGTHQLEVLNELDGRLGLV